MTDPQLLHAAAIIVNAHGTPGRTPTVKSFFDEPTNTVGTTEVENDLIIA